LIGFGEAYGEQYKRDSGNCDTWQSEQSPCARRCCYPHEVSPQS